MNKIDQRFERKILLQVTKQLGDPAKTLRNQNILKWALYLGGGIGLILAYVLATRELVTPIVILFIAGVSGSAIGIGTYMSYVLKQWPITIKHIDTDSLNSRLNELET